MGQIIFSRTRHVYDSYVDFWRLVELSGFPWVYYDQIEFGSDNLYIHSPMNGNYREMMSSTSFDRTCTIAHWLLERPSDNKFREYRDANHELETMNYVDLTIVSDPKLAQEGSFTYIPMGSHAGLGEVSNDKHYDFIGLMAPYPRRQWLFSGDRVRSDVDGLRLAPNMNGVTEPNFRHSLLCQSRFGLNIHNDGWDFCEPLRFVLFAAYGLPIVTEEIPSNTIYSESVCMAHYNGMLTVMHGVKANYERWREWGAYLHNRLTVHDTFRKCLESAL